MINLPYITIAGSVPQSVNILEFTSSTITGTVSITSYCSEPIIAAVGATNYEILPLTNVLINANNCSNILFTNVGTKYTALGTVSITLYTTSESPGVTTSVNSPVIDNYNLTYTINSTLNYNNLIPIQIPEGFNGYISIGSTSSNIYSVNLQVYTQVNSIYEMLNIVSIYSESTISNLNVGKFSTVYINLMPQVINNALYNAGATTVGNNNTVYLNIVASSSNQDSDIIYIKFKNYMQNIVQVNKSFSNQVVSNINPYGGYEITDQYLPIGIGNNIGIVSTTTGTSVWTYDTFINYLYFINANINGTNYLPPNFLFDYRGVNSSLSVGINNISLTYDSQFYYYTNHDYYN